MSEIARRSERHRLRDAERAAKPRGSVPVFLVSFVLLLASAAAVLVAQVRQSRSLAYYSLALSLLAVIGAIVALVVRARR